MMPKTYKKDRYTAVFANHSIAVYEDKHEIFHTGFPTDEAWNNPKEWLNHFVETLPQLRRATEEIFNDTKRHEEDASEN